jgi:hypothetical protein
MWLWVDFNAVDGDTIWTSIKRTASVHEDELKEGQRIELRDHEGDRCWGVITGIKGPIVYVELDWSTWTPAEHEGQRAPSLTTGNPLTSSFGFSFEVTKTLRSSDIALTNVNRTTVLQPQER